jgi:hypothetical protein
LSLLVDAGTGAALRNAEMPTFIVRKVASVLNDESKPVLAVDSGCCRKGRSRAEPRPSGAPKFATTAILCAGSPRRASI